jgi:BASS family bile acid:Na+ symporter
MRLESILGSLSLFMFAGFAIGLVIGDPTGMSAPLSMIALGAIMTLSMSDMVLELGKTGSGFIKGLVPALMTFGILTPIFIAASFLFDGQLRLGWMLTAAMPAAVAIVPYSERMRGDVRLALHGEIAIYLLALALTPAIAIVMLNASVDVVELLKVLLLLIIVPLALSRLVRRARFSERIRGTATNLAFLFFFLIVVGANRNIFFQETQVVLALAIASFVTVFGVGLLVDRTLKGRDDPRRRTLTMFATIKNTGLAIAVALSIGMPEMAIPPTMLVIFEMIWVIYLSSWKYNHKGASNRAPT